MVCFKQVFNRLHRKRILGITPNSFKAYTSSQYVHKARQRNSATQSNSHRTHRLERSYQWILCNTHTHTQCMQLEQSMKVKCSLRLYIQTEGERASPTPCVVPEKLLNFVRKQSYLIWGQQRQRTTLKSRNAPVGVCRHWKPLESFTARTLSVVSY